MKTGIYVAALVAVFWTACETSRAATLIDHWGFEETSGTTVADLQGGDDPGTVNGGVDLNVAGPTGFGSAARFLDTNDNPITINGNSVADTFAGNTTNFSITGWFKAEDKTSDDNKYAFGGQGSGAFVLNLSEKFIGSVPTIQIDRAGAAIDTRAEVAAYIGAWHHIAIVTDGSGFSDIWLDGSLQTNDIDAAISGSLASTATIGANNFHTTRRYFGSIDELKTWQGQLTESEILADMQPSSTAPAPEPSAFILAALALLSLGMTRRRRRR